MLVLALAVVALAAVAADPTTKQYLSNDELEAYLEEAVSGRPAAPKSHQYRDLEQTQF
jgi:hypothetical protein